MYTHARDVLTQEAGFLRFIARRLRQDQHCLQIIAQAGRLMGSTIFGPAIRSIQGATPSGEGELFRAIEGVKTCFSPSTVFLLQTGIQCGWFVPFLELSATLLEEIADLQEGDGVVYPDHFETLVDLFTLAFLVSREDRTLFETLRVVAEHGSQRNRIAFGNLASTVDRGKSFADALELCSSHQRIALPRGAFGGSLSAPNITTPMRKAELDGKLPEFLEGLTDQLAYHVLHGLRLFPTIPRCMPKAEVASEV